MTGSSILYVGDVNMTSAVFKGVFTGFVPAVCVQPLQGEAKTTIGAGSNY